MDNLICVECGEELPFDAHNYGTPEYPCCIHCYNLSLQAHKEEFNEWVITGQARTKGQKVWEKYLKGEL